MNTTSYQDFHITDGVLHAYTGRDEFVIVPEYVHTIGEGAFKACVSLKKAVLPSRLKHILSGAFKGCRKLETIHIPQGVLTVGDYAFHRCHALTSIALPPSVEALGDCVFLYCDSLTAAEIPGVKRMGKQVFVNDVLLQKITVSPQLEEDCICDVFTGCSRLSCISFFHGKSYTFPNAVEAIAGEIKLPSPARAIACDVLRMMELDGRRLVKFLTNLKHVEIPEGIEQIGKSCFFDKRGILSVTLPASLQEIESRAFRNCISLETVRFQNDQILIHEDAFKNCSLLKEIHTSDGNIYRIEGISGCTALQDTDKNIIRTIHQQVLGNFRISGTILLKYLGDEFRVLIPDGITCIAEEAFAGKESIDRVILPDSLTEIGAGAFRDCLLLQTIPLPEKLCRIGEGAFEHCVKLLRVSLPSSLIQVEAKTFKHCHKLKEIMLGKKLTSIGEQAFYGCLSLKEIHFPEHLTAIGAMAFYRCTGLREVCLLPEIHRVGNLAFAESGVKKARLCGNGKGYGKDLFFGCLSLKTIVLENGLCHIPDKLAYGCTALKKIIFPDSLLSAGRNAWENTPFLTQWIKENAAGEVFWNDRNLTGEVFWDGRNLVGEVHLPEQIRIIAGGAFYGNERLTALFIPDRVTWIGPAAFKGCSSLRRVVWPSGINTVEAEVFSGCCSLEYIAHFDAKDDKGEKNASVPWISLKERAFYHCTNLRQISFDDVKYIGKEAFSGCSSLLLHQPLQIPGKAKSLVWVGEQAFACMVKNPGKITGKSCKVLCTDFSLNMAGSIFISGSDYAGEVRLPDGITAISPYAFSGNRQITRIILPDSLRVIGEGAFWGCSSLVRVDFPSSFCVIGARAFEKCTALLEIKLCARHVKARAFACCTALKTAELAGLQTLEKQLFEHCTSLEKCSFGQIKESCTDEILPAHQHKIGDYCFSGCGRLNNISLTSVREIGSYAFQNCDGLSSISLDDDTILHPHAFADCGRLEQIWLTGKEGKLRLCAYALSGCTALVRVIHEKKIWTLHCYRDILSNRLPEIVRLLFHSAFSCFAVAQEENLCAYRGAGRIIHIPYGIRRIEAEVFRDVLMLNQVTIPETVDYIGARAFHGTAWMDRMRRQSPMVTVHAMLLDGSLCEGEVIVPEHIRLVCGWAFAGGMGITRIRFLSRQVRVESYAFRNCIYLKEMQLADGTVIHFHGIDDRKKVLPPLAMQAVTDSLNCFKTDEDNRLTECTGNISRLLVAHGITAIGDHVFQDGNLLTEITLPETVTAIGKSAFSGCRWLKEVKNAQAVKTIGERAFSGCGVLEKIELSQKLSFIEARAFENCTALKEILLPEGLEEIPDRAFFRCHSLEKLSLPSTLKRIGKEAFAFCKNLEMPALPAGVSVGNRAFTGIKKQE